MNKMNRKKISVFALIGILVILVIGCIIAIFVLPKDNEVNQNEIETTVSPKPFIQEQMANIILNKVEEDGTFVRTTKEALGGERILRPQTDAYEFSKMYTSAYAGYEAMVERFAIIEADSSLDLETENSEIESDFDLDLELENFDIENETIETYLSDNNLTLEDVTVMTYGLYDFETEEPKPESVYPEILMEYDCTNMKPVCYMNYYTDTYNYDIFEFMDISADKFTDMIKALESNGYTIEYFGYLTFDASVAPTETTTGYSRWSCKHSPCAHKGGQMCRQWGEHTIPYRKLINSR